MKAWILVGFLLFNTIALADEVATTTTEVTSTSTSIMTTSSTETPSTIAISEGSYPTTSVVEKENETTSTTIAKLDYPLEGIALLTLQNIDLEKQVLSARASALQSNTQLLQLQYQAVENKREIEEAKILNEMGLSRSDMIIDLNTKTIRWVK